MTKKDWLAGLGLIGACALCCALPLLGGVAALGISSFFLNPVVVAVLAFVFVIAGVVIYQRRKANGSACFKPGCSCNSCTRVKGEKSMSKEIPVACCHTVFTKEQRVEYKSIWGELEIRRIGIMEVEKGYQYQFPGDSETLHIVNEWVSMERKCCPFLTFTVIATNENEPVFLQLTGNEEAKAFLRSDINDKINMIITVNEEII